MPKSSVSVSHNLEHEEIMNRLKEFLPGLSQKFQGQIKDIEQSWDENVLSFSFRTMGTTIKGELTVTDDNVTVEQNLPIAAMMFKGRIEESIRSELQKLLA